MVADPKKYPVRAPDPNSTTVNRIFLKDVPHVHLFLFAARLIALACCSRASLSWSPQIIMLLIGMLLSNGFFFATNPIWVFWYFELQSLYSNLRTINYLFRNKSIFLDANGTYVLSFALIFYPLNLCIGARIDITG